MIKELLNNGFQKLENDELVQCASICLRLARNNNDYINSAIFLRELSTDKTAFKETLFNDISHLNKETQKYVYEKSLEKWLDERKASYKDIEPNEPKINIKSIGELMNDIKNMEDSLNDFKTPSGMTPIDTAAFEDENQVLRGKTRLFLSDLYLLKERIRSRCLNYLITLEKQINQQDKANNFQLNIINEVQNYFKERDNSVYQKLAKTLELLSQNDDESYSLLLTEIRRTIKAIADFFYPPIDRVITCSDGKKRQLGEEQYLNRLHEYIINTQNKSTSRELLLLEFENLDKVSRKLNELSSKGVHTNASQREAKQCLISFFNFASNLIFLNQNEET